MQSTCKDRQEDEESIFINSLAVPAQESHLTVSETFVHLTLPQKHLYLYFQMRDRVT